MILKLTVSPLSRNVFEGDVGDAKPFEQKCWYRRSYFFPAYVKHGVDEIGVIANRVDWKMDLLDMA